MLHNLNTPITYSHKVAMKVLWRICQINLLISTVLKIQARRKYISEITA